MKAEEPGLGTENVKPPTGVEWAPPEKEKAMVALWRRVLRLCCAWRALKVEPSPWTKASSMKL